jgi:hypothetical protein
MSSPRPELLVAPCSYQAAKYAVEKWHYSKRMPSTYARLVKLGVWENKQFTGVVIFSHGSNRNIGTPYDLTILDAAELVRVALREHAAPVSQIVSIAIGQLREQSPGVRLLVSYADPSEGHNGGIYQAMNWLYVGKSSASFSYMIDGKKWHKKAAWASFGTNKAEALGATIVADEGKHKYLYPLDRAMRRQIAPLAQPYPKKDTRPVNGDDLATSEAGRFDSEPGALVDSHD